MRTQGQGWRTIHLVAIVLASAVVIIVLAIGVGRSSGNSLRQAVETNTDIVEVRSRLGRIDDLTAQMVLAARQPASMINTPDLLQRRAAVIGEEINQLAVVVASSDHLPGYLTGDQTIERRLTTNLASIEDNSLEAMVATDRLASLALIDASYRLFRDDLTRISTTLDDHESSQLERQVDSSRTLSTVVLIVSTVGVIVMAAAAFVGMRALRRDADVTAQLRAQVVQDPLTGLANRRGLLEAIEQLRIEPPSESQRAALCFLDLDQFKRINDSLGHAVGDQVLCVVGERLAEAFPAPNVVARHGGDEFAILICDRESPLAAAQQAIRLVNEPIHVEGHRLEMTTSLGVRELDADLDATEALREADLAMYEAKADPVRQLAHFDDALVAQAEATMITESRLRTALRERRLEVWYQPMVGTDNSIVGCEALVRWREDGQLVSPGEFLPLAARLGLMSEIDEWVLRVAARDIARLNEYFDRDLWVSVNVDGATLVDGRLVDRVRSTIRESGIRPEWLVIEVTEQAAIDQLDTAVSVLRRVQGLGVRTAIDDFGNGHSSLTRLDRLPFDIVKIDRSLLPSVPSDHRRSALFRAVSSLAIQLGYEVIAEGVETEAQDQLARTSGCSILQGYLYGRPAPTIDFAQLVLTDSRTDAGSVFWTESHGDLIEADFFDGLDRQVRL